MDQYAGNYIHRMFVKGRGRNRKVMMLGREISDKPTHLPSVKPEEAAEKIIEFIKRVGSDTLLFHGEDMLCMDPFMGSYGKEDEWRRYSKYRVNTGEFFKKVQREINVSKFKMSVITKQYGWPAVQALYEEGQHGALVDAEVLSMLCCGKESSLRIRFGHWLSLARWID